MTRFDQGVLAGLSACTCLWAAGVAAAGGLSLVADTDRNGVLDPAVDGVNVVAWSADRGAIVPVDLDDDDQDGQPDGLRGVKPIEQDAALVDLLPLTGVSGEATLTLSLNGPRGTAGLFVKNGDTWTANLNGIKWKASEGLSLAVKASRFAGQDWDGTLKLTATVAEPDGSSQTAETLMRVAPLVISSSTQPAQTIFVRAFPGRNDTMVKQLQRIAELAGAELHVIPGDAPYPANHVWLQDAVEFGHGWTGRPDAIAVAMPSNRNRDIDRFAETALVGPGLGVVQVGAYRPELAQGKGGVSWIDWYGNLEATPPTPGFPFGRVLYGYDPASGAQLNPDVVAFLDAQTLQPSLKLDVGWTLIKHVDEFVCFVPGRPDEAWPYRLVVPDTTVAIGLLERIVAAGHGDAAMLTTFEKAGQTTAASLLADEGFLSFNLQLQAERINPAIERLCAELAIEPEAVIRLPALLKDDGTSRMPNMANALIVNGHMVMADPDGPDLPGGDPFKNYVVNLFTDLPVIPHFVDDQLYHRWSGNVHCATNALRKPLTPVFPTGE